MGFNTVDHISFQIMTQSYGLIQSVHVYAKNFELKLLSINGVNLSLFQCQNDKSLHHKQT